MATIKLTQPQTERLRRLLHMEYTLSELAAELGCARRVLENSIAAGCPHRKEGNRLYVVGNAFADWYRGQPRSEKTPLADDEAFCLHCRAARRIVDAAAVPNSTGVILVSGKCAVCGSTINRFRREAKI